MYNVKDKICLRNGGSPLMRPIRIFVDSTADLSPELIAKYDLTVIPLYVTIGGKAYKDMYEIVNLNDFIYIKSKI